jgi:ATP:ADP antiporter, AAA family
MNTVSALVRADVPEPRQEKGLVERLLSPIADVRRSEAVSALGMGLTMFLVLCGYYLLKTAREAFILSEGGAEVKSYSSAGQALLLLVLVPAYGALASRVNRTQLIQWVTLCTGELTALTVNGFAAVNVAFACGWLGIVVGLRSRLHTRAHETGKAEL